MQIIVTRTCKLFTVGCDAKRLDCRLHNTVKVLKMLYSAVVECKATGARRPTRIGLYEST